KRLFELPRSSWADYDRTLVSQGGGIFDRKAKSIDLTPEIEALTGLNGRRVTPAELINAILKADVDLLWFGGIGTYVKSSEESHAEVGDRANDALRVDGNQLRCKVIGEGANLGCTQLGRIEYVLAGGRLNTDAIDNSAGVDSSDHEVNIKILLGQVMAEGELTEKQRNRLLAEMTEEVGLLVLRNNYLQSQALSLLENQASTLFDQQVRFMQALARDGLLDREIEALPDAEALEERRAKGTGFTRPELAVLMAYAKMTLYQQFLETDLTDSEYLLIDVIKYFPRPLRRQYPKAIVQHRLSGEIIATVTANSIVNRAGVTFVHDVVEETGESLDSIARAYAVSRDAFDLRSLWGQIESLDNKVPAALQIDMLLAIAELLRHGTLWFLRNRPKPIGIAGALAEVRPGIQKLGRHMPQMLTGSAAERLNQKAARLREQGVNKALAARLAALEFLASALDIVQAANDTGRDVAEVGRVYFLLGDELGLDWMRGQAEALGSADYWERSAVASIIDDLFGQQRALAARVLQQADGAEAEQAVEAWCKENAATVARSRGLVEDFRQSGGIDVARLAVANRMVRRMIAG
ncbi:MAG TPA: NAD-glutamate dehydrogenase domain-containing protein, partial [Alphaproteobacteria bacterium]|nr:NAD-glutamate dehydrogenase domain-containing protein [Alphaproteobacteria bacterium]